MHNYTLFFLTIFTLSSSAFLMAMETISLPHHEYILNSYTDIVGNKIHYQPTAHVYQQPLGEKLFSNVFNDKVFIIIDCGNKQKPPYCQTSLLDLETGIDRPYETLAMRATSCHLLTAQTPIVGYQKLFFLRETFNMLRCIKNGYEYPRIHKLEIAQTLEPILAHADQAVSDDTYISTIDSCDSHLVAISSNGFITTWAKNGTLIDSNSRQKGFCDQPFFSAGFNKKEKMICLGLNNGKIFVTSIPNLDQAQILNLFPQQIKVNWISVSENNFLFAGICKTKKEIWESRDKEWMRQTCCKKTVFPPQACFDCISKYCEEDRTTHRQISGTIQDITNILSQIKNESSRRHHIDCEHTQKARDESCLPSVCNKCQEKSYYTVITSAQLKEKKEQLVESNIVEYDKKNNQVVGFYLIDDKEIILSHVTKIESNGYPKVLLTSLTSQKNIDFLGRDFLTSLICLIFLSRGNSKYSIISPDLLSTNKPDSMSYINKSVRRIIARAPYYWAPLTVPLQFIISFIKTSQLSIPTAGALLLFLYCNSSTAFHVE